MGKVIFLSNSEGERMSEEKYKENLIGLAKLILFFTSKTKYRLYKTKLNKLLFYTQFLFYKNYGIRLLNYEFIRDHHGPVLKCLDEYLKALNDTGIIDLVETDYGLTVESMYTVQKSEYSNKEYEILNKIVKKFDRYTAADISEYSHKESLWYNTGFKQIIDLNRANELNDIFI